MTTYWYAWLMDAEDNDWGTGWDNEETAIAELIKRHAEYPESRIAVIEEGNDPICVDIIEYDDVM